jgi:hypothetical protein
MCGVAGVKVHFDILGPVESYGVPPCMLVNFSYAMVNPFFEVKALRRLFVTMTHDPPTGMEYALTTPQRVNASPSLKLNDTGAATPLSRP